MSTIVHVGSRTAVLVKKVFSWLGIALLVSLGLLGPRVVPLAQVALWYVVDGGPPLDFGLPHNGQIVAHIDVLGRVPPDIARIRISEVSTGTTVWDVKPTTTQSEPRKSRPPRVRWLLYAPGRWGQDARGTRL